MGNYVCGNNHYVSVAGQGLEMAGSISGSVTAFSKSGVGNITFSGNNSSFTGYMYITGSGTCYLNASNCLPSSGTGLYTFTNFDVNSAYTFTCGFSLAGNISFLGSSNVTFGAMTLIGNYTLTVSANTMTCSTLAGAFTLTKAGSGTLKFTGANTSSGTTINAGSIQLTNTSGIKGALTIGSAGTLDLSGISAPATLSGGTSLTASSATGTIIFNMAGSGATTISIAGNINLTNLSIVLVGTPSGSTTFNLISYTGTLTGTPTLTTTTLNGHTVSLNSTAGTIRVTTGA
jgi:autotransporter-associated beta strand protein